MNIMQLVARRMQIMRERQQSALRDAGNSTNVVTPNNDANYNANARKYTLDGKPSAPSGAVVIGASNTGKYTLPGKPAYPIYPAPQYHSGDTFTYQRALRQSLKAY